MGNQKNTNSESDVDNHIQVKSEKMRSSDFMFIEDYLLLLLRERKIVFQIMISVLTLVLVYYFVFLNFKSEINLKIDTDFKQTSIFAEDRLDDDSANEDILLAEVLSKHSMTSDSKFKNKVEEKSKQLGISGSQFERFLVFLANQDRLQTFLKMAPSSLNSEATNQISSDIQKNISALHSVTPVYERSSSEDSWRTVLGVQLNVVDRSRQAVNARADVLSKYLKNQFIVFMYGEYVRDRLSHLARTVLAAENTLVKEQSNIITYKRRREELRQIKEHAQILVSNSISEKEFSRYVSPSSLVSFYDVEILKSNEHIYASKFNISLGQGLIEYYQDVEKNINQVGVVADLARFLDEQVILFKKNRHQIKSLEDFQLITEIAVENKKISEVLNEQVILNNPTKILKSGYSLVTLLGLSVLSSVILSLIYIFGRELLNSRIYRNN